MKEGKRYGVDKAPAIDLLTKTNVTHAIRVFRQCERKTAFWNSLQAISLSERGTWNCSAPNRVINGPLKIYFPWSRGKAIHLCLSSVCIVRLFCFSPSWFVNFSSLCCWLFPCSLLHQLVIIACFAEALIGIHSECGDLQSGFTQTVSYCFYLSLGMRNSAFPESKLSSCTLCSLDASTTV